MGLGDPFAAFLSFRNAPSPDLDTTKAQPIWQATQAQESTASRGDLSSDPFASFIALRPGRPSPPPETATEQSLREDLLRTKRRLLEVGLKAELRALDPSCPPDTAARLKQVRRAQRYLQHPEYTREAMSGAASDASDEEQDPRPGGPASSAEAATLRSPQAANGGRSALSSAAATPAGASSQQRRASPKLSQSASMPVLGETARSTSRAGDTTFLPPIVGGFSQMSTMRPKSALDEDKIPLLQGWWTRTKSWNIAFGSKDLTAERHNLTMSGGTVVLGNGRIPLFTGTHLLNSGYFYSFQVEAIDDKHFPLTNMRDLSFGFGVSRFSAQHRHCERPVFAYEIPSAVLVGYGDHLIDKSKWRHTEWNPRELREKDVVGVLIAPDGDLVIFVNEAQVLRVPTSLAEDGDYGKTRSQQRRTLYPVVDLHGRVAAVTLLPRQSPPNKPLQCRNRLR